jgi:hypothetical protein
MDLAEFRATQADAAPPSWLSLPLQALWWDAKGHWEKAHGCAQDDTSPAGSAVHAYLHRVEGDLGNAGYWYSRAGRPKRTDPLPVEWEALATEFLGAYAG